jgi:16S rRNA (guanine527-N7)-methyltransferase
MTGRRDAIVRLCEQAGIEPFPGWGEYFELAKQWGARTDLTSARTDHELAEILFLDASQLIAAGWCALHGSLVDVGAGVGAPSIPILLAETSIEGTLVEPRRIRTAFLRTAIGVLGIAPRVRVLEQRVDPKHPALPRPRYGVALSRATFPPEQWLAIGAQLAEQVWILTAGGQLALGERYELLRRLDYRVPSSGAPRAVLACRERVG